MDREEFEDHLRFPQHQGELLDAYSASAGGAACGDHVAIYVRTDGATITQITHEASGCTTIQVAASVACDALTGVSLLKGARFSAEHLNDLLGGLTPGKRHAADLTADAIAIAISRALIHSGSIPTVRGRAMVAMSGGVDSSTVALLLRNDGHDLVACTVELWRDTDNDAGSSCCSISAVRTARLQAHRLGIPHITMDLRDSFADQVVAPFLDGHRRGDIVNPCVTCNGDVRIDAMLRLADKSGCEVLATGHYARTAQLNGTTVLKTAVDQRKDQTYMLSRLRTSTLQRLLFPLGGMTKTQVRETAASYGLLAAKTPDSQDLCFLAGTTRDDFLKKHAGIDAREGAVITSDGTVVGTHDGHWKYTVGQRRGLRDLKVPGRVFVIETRPETNEVVVGIRNQIPVRTIAVRGARIATTIEDIAHVKLRYKSTPIPCTVTENDGRLTVHVDDPEAAAAPGQAAVFLDISAELIVGTGTITRT